MDYQNKAKIKVVSSIMYQMDFWCFNSFVKKSSTLQTLQTGRGCKSLNEDMTKYIRHHELKEKEIKNLMHYCKGNSTSHSNNLEIGAKFCNCRSCKTKNNL